MMSLALAQDIADAMTHLHPGWQVPGCRRMLLDSADLAPAGELSRAALAFAESPGIKAPSLEVFRDPAGEWWHPSMPQHARTVRPSDQPKCKSPGHENAPAWIGRDDCCGLGRAERIGGME